MEKARFFEKGQEILELKMKQYELAVPGEW